MDPVLSPTAATSHRLCRSASEYQLNDTFLHRQASTEETALRFRHTAEARPARHSACHSADWPDLQHPRLRQKEFCRHLAWKAVSAPGSASSRSQFSLRSD